MANAPDDSFLARWLRGAVASEPEPADLGTAFGLDISVQPLLDEPADRPPPTCIPAAGSSGCGCGRAETSAHQQHGHAALGHDPRGHGAEHELAERVCPCEPIITSS